MYISEELTKQLQLALRAAEQELIVPKGSKSKRTYSTPTKAFVNYIIKATDLVNQNLDDSVSHSYFYALEGDFCTILNNWQPGAEDDVCLGASGRRAYHKKPTPARPHLRACGTHNGEHLLSRVQKANVGGNTKLRPCGKCIHCSKSVTDTSTGSTTTHIWTG
jgi:hypothetical protein